MPLTPSFSASQNFGSITTLTLTDTSTGTDSSVSFRLVYLLKADGTYLVPTGTTTNYIIWPYADSSIDIVVLYKDYALDIKVDWIAGTSISYTDTVLNLFKAYTKRFLIGLGVSQTSNKMLTTSKTYMASKSKLRELLSSAEEAVSENNDIASAQLHLNLAKEFIDNKELFH